MAAQKPLSSLPKLPWKTRLSIGAHTLAVNAACRPDGTLNRFFTNLIDFKVSPSSHPVGGVTTADVTVDPSRGLWFRLFLPDSSAASHPVVFYFHGGGFAFFAPDSRPYHRFCQTLARQLPAVVVSVNYRLSPEHRFPAPYDDGFDVLRFVDGADDFPAAGDPSRCFVAGDSAGGNLAHHVALRAGSHAFRRLRVAGLVAIQPYFGGEEITESEVRLAGAPLSSSAERAKWMWKLFLPEGSDRDHPAANVAAAIGEAAGKLPAAAMVVVGGLDPLQDRQKGYYEALKERSGLEARLVEYPTAIHGFYAFPELPEASLLASDIKDFVQNVSASHRQ